MAPMTETQARLIIQSRPGKRWLLLGAGLSLMGVGLLILLLTDSMVTLTCRRTANAKGKIELKSSRVLGSSSREAALESVTDVVIRRGISRGGGGVVLETTNGEFSLASLSTGRANELAGELTAFLSTPAMPDLTIRQDSRPATYGVGLGMIAVGFLILALGFETVLCTFDRSASKVAIERRGLLGARRAEYELGDIADIRSEWVTNRKKAKAVYLILKSGSRIHAGWPGQSFKPGEIRGFLGLREASPIAPRKEDRH
jgi:hypothetical protein